MWLNEAKCQLGMEWSQTIPYCVLLQNGHWLERFGDVAALQRCSVEVVKSRFHDIGQAGQMWGEQRGMKVRVQGLGGGQPRSATALRHDTLLPLLVLGSTSSGYPYIGDGGEKAWTHRHVAAKRALSMRRFGIWY